MKSGFVSIVGRPNVGKSTLLNSILGTKIAITSDKVGTTRNIIQGIYNDKDSQIIFVDTPGITKNKGTKLESTLNKKAYNEIDNDLVLFLVDVSEKFGKTDEKILERLKNDNKDVILVLNKIDKIPKDELFLHILKLKDLYDFKDIVPLSGLKGTNIKELIKVIKTHLKDNIMYFSSDELTNIDEKFMISELIREKVLNLTHEEVPHSVTCLVEAISFKNKRVDINALIIVDRDNLKKIIIGKNGDMIKKIGTYARRDIESFLKKEVYLELYVKTIKNWKDKENLFEYLNLSDKNF